MPAPGPGRSRRWWCAAVLGLCAGAVAAVGATPAHASFTQEGSPIPVGVNPYGIVTADFNLDGRPDVATVNGTSSTLSVLLRQPTGGFSADLGSPFATGAGPSYAATGDLNADGRPDAAVANYVDGSVTVLLRQAGGGFAAEPGPVPSAPGAAAIAAVDVNGDGRLDLAVPDYNNGGITILLRKPTNDGYTAEGASAPTGIHPRNLTVADFNADGHPDLAVTNFGSGTVSILLRKPTNDGFVTEAGSPIAVGTNPSGIVARDFDGDGRPDIALSNYGSDTVSVLLRTPAGGFAADAGSPIPVGDGPSGVASADLNGDGRPDLAVAGNVSGTVSVLLRQATGGFAQDLSSPLPLAGANGVTAADFTGDGLPDLAVTSDSTSTLATFVNTTPPPIDVSPPPPPPVQDPPVTPKVATQVVSVAARLMSIGGGGAGAASAAPPALRDALSEAPLASALAAPQAKSNVETELKQAAKGRTAKDEMEKRLDSLVYGIPVQLDKQQKGLVEIAAVIAIEREKGKKREITQITLPPTAVELAQNAAMTARIPVDAAAAKELQKKGTIDAAISIQAEKAQQDLDSMSEMGETESLRLQMAMDRMSKMTSTLSNLLKKIGETSSAIVGNIKRTVATPAAKVSRKTLQKQAAAAATKASAEGHTAAVLLAKVVKPQVSGGTRATFRLKPCPKRCPYPGFAKPR